MEELEKLQKENEVLKKTIEIKENIIQILMITNKQWRNKILRICEILSERYR